MAAIDVKGARTKVSMRRGPWEKPVAAVPQVKQRAPIAKRVPFPMDDAPDWRIWMVCVVIGILITLAGAYVLFASAQGAYSGLNHFFSHRYL